MDNANIDWKRYIMSYNVNGDQEKELAKVIHVYKLNSSFFCQLECLYAKLI